MGINNLGCLKGDGGSQKCPSVLPVKRTLGKISVVLNFNKGTNGSHGIIMTEGSAVLKVDFTAVKPFDMGLAITDFHMSLNCCSRSC